MGISENPVKMGMLFWIQSGRLDTGYIAVERPGKVIEGGEQVCT